MADRKPDAKPEPARAPGSGPRADSGTETHTGSGPGPWADPGTARGPGPEADAEAGTEADTDVPPGPGHLTVPSMSAGPDFGLRPWEMSDLPLVREAAQDPYIPLITTIPSRYSDKAAEAFVRRQWDRAASGAGYPFAIVRSRDRRPVGSIGLWLRELPEGRASIGFWMVAAGRGQGVTRAALRTVTDWALHDLGVPRLQLFIEPWNTASARIAEHVGFRREGLLRGWQQVGDERRDMAVYGLLNSDGRPDGRAVTKD
ncbi:MULTISPECIES: GNAT family protein [Streptomyces]|uniref:GNAT family N-acetyltransferase n=1 Tax=unclassified Streptomyces TaxID=2593676 RepID=UPI001CEFA373|nr:MULTISPECIES: GNAT family protein [Streptomyces]